MARWTVTPKAFAGRMGVALRKEIQRITFDMFLSVVNKSPIDTGFFCGNWRVTYGAIPTGTVNRFDQSKTGAQREVAKVLSNVYSPKSSGKTIVSLFNNAPYAYRLETGWSKQAPRGMVRLSLLETVVRIGK